MRSKRSSGKPANSKKGFLLNVARTIGSTLGTLAAKTEPVLEHLERPVPRKKVRSKSGKSRIRRSA
jgi:hypothetical protein